MGDGLPFRIGRSSTQLLAQHQQAVLTINILHKGKHMHTSVSSIVQDQIIPRLRSAVPKSVRCVGAEDSQDLISEGTVMAFKAVSRLQEQGRLYTVAPSSTAFYIIQKLKSGRRASGTSSVDVYGSSTQLNGSASLLSLNEVVSEDSSETLELQDVISQDQADPSLAAASSIDWRTLCASLTKLELLLLKCLVKGLGIREAAALAKVSYDTMLAYRKKLAMKIRDYMGETILQDIATLPAWFASIDCERQMLAARADRRH